MKKHPDHNEALPGAKRSGIRAKVGFTLMEMLIVIAIIAVLVAIAIPVLDGQLERAKIATDEANVRSGYALVAEDLLVNPAGTGAVTYIYNLSEGKVTSGAAGSISPYGQSDQEADYEIAGVPVSGTPEGNYVTYTVTNGQITSIKWGTGASFSKWLGLSGTTVESDKWWTGSDVRSQGFATLIASDNATRKEADLDILNALASYFDGMDANEAKKILGESRYNKVTRPNGNETLFEYTIDGAGSIRISNLDTTYQPYFSELGYDARNYNANAGGADVALNTGYNYLNKYLFTSNEMVNKTNADGSHAQTSNNIRISFDIDEDNKIVNTKVWVNQLKGDGYISSN